MKKQIFVILLIVCMLLVFCGCKENSDLSSSLSTTMSNISEPSSEISTSFISSTQSVENLSSDKLSSNSNVLSNEWPSTNRRFSISFAYNGTASNPFIIVLGDSLQVGTLYWPRYQNEEASITWSYKISDESVVRIANNENTNKPSFSCRGCTVEALKPGTATISATWYCKGESSSSSFMVKVVKPEDLERRISFNDSSGKIQNVHAGEKDWIGIGYSYAFFSIKDEEYKIEFKVSDETKVQVSYTERTLQERKAFGDEVFVYGLSPGDVTLTVTVFVGEKAITDTCRIRVEEPRNISSLPSGTASSFLSSN